MGVYKLSASGGLKTGRTLYNSFLAGNPATLPPFAYELIGTQIVSGSSTASVTFDVSTLASTYKHLQLRMVHRSGINVSGDDHQMRFNGDSTYTNYRSHYLYGSGSAVTSATMQSTQFPGVNLTVNTADASHTSGIHTPTIVDILDPFSTSKYKTTKSMSGMPNAGTANFGISIVSGLWMSTTAVTSITIYPYPGSSPYISAGSRYSLYGIRG